MQLKIKAKDLRIDDHIAGIGVVDALHPTQAIEVGVDGGRSYLFRAESEIEVHRPPAAVKPSDAVGKTVMTIRGSIRVSGCIDNGDGTSILCGYTRGDRRDWVGVASSEPLEVVLP